MSENPGLIVPRGSVLKCYYNKKKKKKPITNLSYSAEDVDHNSVFLSDIWSVV